MTTLWKAVHLSGLGFLYDSDDAFRLCSACWNSGLCVYVHVCVYVKAFPGHGGGAVRLCNLLMAFAMFVTSLCLFVAKECGINCLHVGANDPHGQVQNPPQQQWHHPLLVHVAHRSEHGHPRPVSIPSLTATASVRTGASQFLGQPAQVP